jgi:hypothetical protein
MKKQKIGELEVGSYHWDGKEWCVYVKSPKETIRFFLPGKEETEADNRAGILADMIRSYARPA